MYTEQYTVCTAKNRLRWQTLLFPVIYETVYIGFP